jgi:hypothetical protein
MASGFKKPTVIRRLDMAPFQVEGGMEATFYFRPIRKRYCQPRKLALRLTFYNRPNRLAPSLPLLFHLKKKRHPAGQTPCGFVALYCGRRLSHNYSTNAPTYVTENMEAHPFVCPASRCTYGSTGHVTKTYVRDSN